MKKYRVTDRWIHRIFVDTILNVPLPVPIQLGNLQIWQKRHISLATCRNPKIKVNKKCFQTITVTKFGISTLNLCSISATD